MRFSDPFADIAEKVAKEMEEEARQSPETDTSIDAQKTPYQTLNRRIKYNWRPEDASILKSIRAATDGLISRELGGVITELDELYMSIRVPDHFDSGVVKTDEKGRVIWKTDENGKVVEDWSLLTGQDIETCLLGLSREKVVLAQRVEELFSEALFSKHIFNDSWYESYEKTIEGTQREREARANREGRQDKYAAFFRYTLWRSADALLKEINSTMRLLERVRDWRIRSERS